MIANYLELLNATLGISLLLIILIVIRDFKKEFLNKDKKIQVSLALSGFGIVVFSIKEIYKYGVFGTFDPVIAELLETMYLLLTLGAFFYLLRAKELHVPKIKS